MGIFRLFWFSHVYYCSNQFGHLDTLKPNWIQILVTSELRSSELTWQAVNPAIHRLLLGEIFPGCRMLMLTMMAILMSGWNGELNCVM